MARAHGRRTGGVGEVRDHVNTLSPRQVSKNCYLFPASDHQSSSGGGGIVWRIIQNDRPG